MKCHLFSQNSSVEAAYVYYYPMAHSAAFSISLRYYIVVFFGADADHSDLCSSGLLEL